MNIEIIGKNGMLGGALLEELKMKNNNIETLLKNKTILWSAGTLQKDLSEQKIENELQKFKKIVQEFSSKNFNNFVYLSSAGSLYPSNKNVISTESSEVIPINSYGFLKQAEEEIIRSKFHQYFDKIIIIRLANVYGRTFTNFDKLGLIDRAIYCAINNLELKINVDKASRKNYGFKRDYAKKIVTILENDNKFDSLEIFNLGPSFSYSIEELISVIGNHFKTKIKVTYTNQNVTETVLIKSENEKLRSINKELDRWIKVEEYLAEFAR